MAAPVFSLIVATKGRAEPFGALFASLAAQTRQDFEVIVVDQNGDDRIGSPADEGWPFALVHVRTPEESGLSRARNAGLPFAQGHYVLFPDDDCWYPPTFLARAAALLEASGADVVTGRATDETGRSINGRYEPSAATITRDNVFTAGIEWVTVFRREVLERVGGYDPAIGVGSGTPWQSCEGQDILLRCLAGACRCLFDPALFGHHAELDIRAPSMKGKGRAYARGMGYVLRRHNYPLSRAAYWIARPTLRAVLSVAKGDAAAARYYRDVALGRYEGWRMRAAGTTPPVAAQVRTATGQT